MSASVAPYEALAAIYDHVMRHVDYRRWAAYVQDLLTGCGWAPGAVLDIACGTGSMALQLHAAGLQVTHGVDSSAAMLRVARKRALEAGADIAFDVRPMDDLGGLGPFAAAVCMYDSLNYAPDLASVQRVLSAVHQVLLPGGIFVFDVCTQANSVRYFHDYHDHERGPGFEYRRHSYYNSNERLQVNDFTIHLEGCDTALLEHHRQRIYRLADLRQAVAASPLALMGVYDEFSRNPGTERSDRVHFVLRRQLQSGAGGV